MIRMHLDVSKVMRSLSAAEKQIPFAVSLALNRVAVDAQKAEQSHLKQAFQLRRPDFVLRGIKIEKADRATKTSWRVVITIPVTQDFLNKFEEGDPKVPRSGKWLWIPNPEVFQRKVISRSNPLHPKQLHFQRSKGGQVQGNERTFMIRGKDHPLVLQRVDQRLTKASYRIMKSMTLDNVHVGIGPRRRKDKAIHRTGGTRLLYVLKSRVSTPVRLEFVSTLTRQVMASWPSRMDEAVSEAMRNAKQ